MNPQECVWETRCRIIIKTTLQEKVRIHCSITIWFTSLFLCLKLWKFQPAKAAVDKEWEKLEKFSAWNLTKVKSKNEVIDEARASGAKVHFASLMDLRHLKNAELEAKHQKYKGRVALRGDIVKDDSALTQYSLNKDHQHLKWQPPRSMESSPDCLVAMDKQQTQYLLYTQVKMEDAPKLLKNPKSECPDIWFVYHNTNGLNHCPVCKTPVVRSWAESVRSSFCRTIVGKVSWENPIETWLERNSKLGMSLCVHREKQDYSYLCMWMP